MNTKVKYRILISSSFLLTVLVIVLNLFMSDATVEQLFIELVRIKPSVTLNVGFKLIFSGCLIVLLIISLIGLFFFKKYSRFLYIICNLFGLVLILFFNVHIIRGFDMFILSLNNIFVGVIIALAYSNPISLFFDGK